MAGDAEKAMNEPDERLKAEEAALAAYEDKMTAISGLASGINHEVCNPVGIARGQCELFLLNLREGMFKKLTPEQVIEKAAIACDKVIKAADRASAITKRFSVFFKPPPDALPQEADVSEVVDETVHILTHQLRMNNIQVNLEGDNIRLMIPGGKCVLRRILFDLIRLAADIAKKRGEIQIRTSVGDDFKRLRVSGTMREEAKSRLCGILKPSDISSYAGPDLFAANQCLTRVGGRMEVRNFDGNYEICLDF